MGSEGIAEYVMKRVITVLITILVIACVTFVLIVFMPDSPFSDGKITPEQKVAMEAKHGMDDPLGVQMLRYLERVIVDQDSGVSLKIQKGYPVLDIITEKSPLSAKIGVIALVWAVAVDIPLDCLAIYNRGKWVDNVLRVVYVLGTSMPGFVVTTFLPMLFCNDGAPFKLMGIDVIFDASRGARAYLMPCLALGLYLMCYIAHPTRFSMLDALGRDYIRTTQAKGLLTPRIIFKHTLRSGVIPVITYLGLLTALTLVGGFVVETIYIIPDLGRYLVRSVQNRDYFIIMGTIISLAALVVIMNLAVDILYRVMDPRIDLTKGE